ncbi:helix-turn-helix domain-containing protein [Kribbella sp. CA-293567]|uniref:helix-turn-helix domain-containing protein n=1 Tax=Kribbella sp. CA-293567 TaxID=3002436 RepID=UPI0022DE65C7|nr:helix-turn-helix domain-containing protein [Kribbella sp. CA-293567]WBQ07449.1 helix-turn-helix domain-containing protein [Kribbella sp. CA-293567]
MNLRDPAEPDAVTPTVRRLLAGEFDEGPGYATYRRRGTTDWLLMHTLDGVGALGSGVFAGPGITTLIRPGTLQDYGTAHDRWHFLFAHFHPRPDWLPLLEWPSVAPGILQLQPGPHAAEQITRALSEAVRYQDSVLSQGELLSYNALEAALLWCDTQNPKAAQLDDRLLRAIEYVDRNLRGDLSIAVLARTSNLSVSRFAHLFRQQVGVPPQQFVERRRLDAAARLLELTTRPVAAIAADAGFTNPLYFSTRFRAHTGHSPTQYRRQLGSALL